MGGCGRDWRGNGVVPERSGTERRNETPKSPVFGSLLLANGQKATQIEIFFILVCV